MLFNSWEFILFLPTVFLLYWFVFNRYFKLQNLFIVVVSYMFYGWWDWRFLFLIALTTILSFYSGMLIANSENNRKQQKIISAANITVNLIILCLFKYFNFFSDNLVRLFKVFYELDWFTIDILLPVGISFYTFQALSYSIDVYTKKIQPTRDIVSFFAFVSFFPQLVAGPIERATNLLPQFYKKRSFVYSEAIDGMRQILWGLFKKIVVADNCAFFANQIFNDYQTQSGATLLLGAVYFTFQIYCDFSGYSDIAIGTARLFGINLMRNFNFPYFSSDIAEFWRRWHISLTTWFRDYIYIPLGGSRVSKLNVIRNTFIIFLVSGFWHGANWTFIAWGLYHAVLFLPLLLFGLNRVNVSKKGERGSACLRIFRIIITFFLVVIGWVFFRASSISMALEYIKNIFSKSLFQTPEFLSKTTVIVILLLMAVEWIQRDKQHALQLEQVKSSFLRCSIYYVVLVLIYFCAGTQQAFIYFQF